MEGSLFADQRENGLSDTQRHPNLHRDGQALFLLVRRP